MWKPIGPRAEERAVERVRGDRQRPVEPVVLTGDAPVRLDEQLRQVRERFDGRVALDEPDVVESEAVTERAPVDEDGDEGAQERPSRRRPRRHQKWKA